MFGDTQQLYYKSPFSSQFWRRYCYATSKYGNRIYTEVLALLNERSRKQIKITWQFSLHAARTKLNTHYTRVHPQNEQYKET